MTTPKRTTFSRRAPDHVTDALVDVLSKTKSYEFKELFLKVFAVLKLKNAVSGGEEMLRLRCYEKLQNLTKRGLACKTGRNYNALKGIEQASSVHQLARADAAVAARVAAAG